LYLNSCRCQSGFDGRKCSFIWTRRRYRFCMNATPTKWLKSLQYKKLIWILAEEKLSGNQQWLLIYFILYAKPKSYWIVAIQITNTKTIKEIYCIIIYKIYYCFLLMELMLTVFNATFKNISVISSMTVSFIGGGNHRPVASHWQTLSHNVVHLALSRIRTSMVIDTDCIGSCKSNYHTIKAMTVPKNFVRNIWK
jgi:hypothetical protein